MKTRTIIVFSDPGHAWGKALKSQLVALGIEKAITSYSYQRNEYAYLEEDSDLQKYVRALKDKGVIVKFDERNCNKSSKIRSYDHYRV